jgi:CheY-like chemotaxis protein
MKKRILLVDDDEIVHFINRKVIEHAGFDCDIHSASSAEEALRLISQTLPKPDVIFVDLNMPKMNGFDFVRAFKKINPSEIGTRIAILTSSNDQRDQDVATQLGVDFFISKPLTEETVAKVLAGDPTGNH